jgi:hypothetical protein
VTTIAPPVLVCQARYPSAPELELPPSHGIWIGSDEADANARSLSGAAPDVEVRTQDFTTGSDAIALAVQRWPGRSVVRAVSYRIDIRSVQALR